MIDSFYIAWKYLSYYRGRTAILVSCIILIAFMPLALELLLDESERQLLARATDTPLLVGARGSSLDLVMSTIYFGDEVPEPVTMSVADQISESGLATAIPMHVEFRARNHPVVGTTLEYFEFRDFRTTQGRAFAVLGECVLGATVARNLGLEVGDTIVSSPSNLFDLAGTYPLKMKIVGVLERTQSADDLAVFVDVRTTWIMQGLMHGHEDLQAVEDPELILDRQGDTIIGSAKLREYTEVTDENIDEFHLHGDPSTAPITAVIAVPFDPRSDTILQGRFVARDLPVQIVRAAETVDTLLANIFRIKSVLDAVILVVGLGTILALILVFALSLRLRQREIQTISRIGCRRMTTGRLLAAEVGIVVGFAALICVLLLAGVEHFDERLVRILFVR